MTLGKILLIFSAQVVSQALIQVWQVDPRLSSLAFSSPIVGLNFI